MKERVRIPEGYNPVFIAQWTMNLCSDNQSEVVMQCEKDGAFYVAYRWLESEWMYRLVRFFKIGETAHASVDIGDSNQARFIVRLLNHFLTATEEVAS